MPVSGRPTNAALLKITQGASGPEANGLQKARSRVTEVVDSLRLSARAELSANQRVATAAKAAASAKPSAATAMIHARAFLNGPSTSTGNETFRGLGRTIGAGGSRRGNLRQQA